MPQDLPMPDNVAVARIEDYALIGNTRTAALVHRNGAIDWLCAPNFDSPACFAALLGTAENGSWTIAPREKVLAARRGYIEGTLVLETIFETASGIVQITDFMPPADDPHTDIIRIITGVQGTVPMMLDVRFRFDYGGIIPWVRRHAHGITAVAGPDAVRLCGGELTFEGRGWSTVSEFTVKAGQTFAACLTWYPSYKSPPPLRDPHALLTETVRRWREWSARCDAPAEWHDAVVRSAITLKALTHRTTGGIVAAPTTSLPELIGGVRNWDYRYCWLRDATLTLYALMNTGYIEEAQAWRQWLVRAAAGEPSKLQIMYSLSGERRLPEYALPWLSGFGASQPVRIGNAAHTQRQMDVYGEVIDTLHAARMHGLEADDNAWRIQLELVHHLEKHWRDAGAGIWEQRGPDQRYVHSSVMVWVAIDRTIKSIESFGLDVPTHGLKRLRQTIHEEVCAYGYSSHRQSFVQYFGSEELDASTLQIPLVGFLPIDDPRVVSTIEAIQRELTVDGFVLRYKSHEAPDGLPPGEGTFLACSLWLADNLALMGRMGEAREMFDRVLAVRNDVGLLAEEYDPVGKRQLGNFPQAFSHVGVINTAKNLSPAPGPNEERAKGESEKQPAGA